MFQIGSDVRGVTEGELWGTREGGCEDRCKEDMV